MQFFNQTIISSIVIVLFVISISCQIIIGVFLQKGIQNTDHVKETNQGILKLCRQKFIQSYKANGGVANISIFVDKFINKLKFAHIRVISYRHLSGQIMLIGVFVAGLGICKGLMEGTMLFKLLPYYMICFFGLYVYFCVTAMVDEKGRRYMLRVNLIDYLENHVAIRLANGYEENENLLKQEGKEKKVEKVEKEKGEADHRNGKGEFTKEDAEELEALLKAFMA